MVFYNYNALFQYIPKKVCYYRICVIETNSVQCPYIKHHATDAGKVIYPILKTNTVVRYVDWLGIFPAKNVVRNVVWRLKNAQDNTKK